jgi:hypothetical protein
MRAAAAAADINHFEIISSCCIMPFMNQTDSISDCHLLQHLEGLDHVDAMTSMIRFLTAYAVSGHLPSFSHAAMHLHGQADACVHVAFCFRQGTALNSSKLGRPACIIQNDTVIAFFAAYNRRAARNPLRPREVCPIRTQRVQARAFQVSSGPTSPKHLVL